MKNSGLIEFSKYLVLRLLGNTTIQNPYFNDKDIEQMLIRGALDAFCEITACLCLMPMIVIELLAINGYLVSGSNCMLSCRWSSDQQHISMIGPMILTLFTAMLLRIVLLRVERMVLVRAYVIARKFRSSIGSSVLSRVRTASVSTLSGAENHFSLRKTVSRIFQGE